jgi:zinc transporter ZupT
MKPIGWMILISDILHSFIDGITIGAIAMVSISECMRMMVPIACEEFSHKLGKRIQSDLFFFCKPLKFFR